MSILLNIIVGVLLIVGVCSILFALSDNKLANKIFYLVMGVILIACIIGIILMRLHFRI